jgi:hypothetical protein
VRGLSPARSRGKSLLPRARKTAAAEAEAAPPEELAPYAPEQFVAHSGSLRPGGEALAPLMEGPEVAEDDACGEESARRDGFGQWVRGHLARAPLVAGGGGDASFRRSDLRLLLGVMGAPLAPVSASAAEPLPHLSVKGAPIVSTHLGSLDWISSVRELLLGKCGSVLGSDAAGGARSVVVRCRSRRRRSTSCSSTWRRRAAPRCCGRCGTRTRWGRSGWSRRSLRRPPGWSRTAAPALPPPWSRAGSCSGRCPRTCGTSSSPSAAARSAPAATAASSGATRRGSAPTPPRAPSAPSAAPSRSAFPSTYLSCSSRRASRRCHWCQLN